MDSVNSDRSKSKLCRPNFPQNECNIYEKVTETSDGRGEVTETAEMSCTVMARPRPKIDWLLHGVKVLQDPDKYEITMEEKSETEVKSYLKILA